jgi:hypothetical protein
MKSQTTTVVRTKPISIIKIYERSDPLTYGKIVDFEQLPKPDVWFLNQKPTSQTNLLIKNASFSHIRSNAPYGAIYL